MSKISNSSIKRCRNIFLEKGIGKTINSALDLFNTLSIEEIIAEFIYDYDNKKLYNVLLYLIRENYKEYLDELKKFNYL